MRVSELPDRMAYKFTEVGQLLGLSLTKVQDLVRSGDLEAIRIGRSVRITRAALDRFLERREVPTGRLSDTVSNNYASRSASKGVAHV